MSAAPDIGPGVLVERYRGPEAPPFVRGAVFVVTRAWEPEGWAPCDDCLPGFSAPCIEIQGLRPPPGSAPLCSCTFRPVYPRSDRRRPPPEHARSEHQLTAA